MVDMKFTWYIPNGFVKSKIDRVSISKDWLETWPNSKKFVYSKSVSDHCALVLKDASLDRGKKSFRSLDIWQRDGRFIDFMREKSTMMCLEEGCLCLRKN